MLTCAVTKEGPKVPNKQELTAKQREVLDAVQTWIQERGRPPTLREMALRMGVSSTNAIRDHLRVLEGKGYLKREARLSRGLEVIRGGKADDEPERTPTVLNGPDHDMVA